MPRRFELFGHKPSKPLAAPGGSRKKQEGWVIEQNKSSKL